MDNSSVRQQVIIFDRARKNLLAVVIITFVNLMLAVFNADIYLLFSASAPQFIFELGRGMYQELQAVIVLLLGYAGALIAIVPYAVCWFFSKRLRFFMLIALILFSMDTLMFLFILVLAEFDVSCLLDIAFHVWVLYYLVNGVMAWTKLNGISNEQYNSSLKQAVAIANGQPIDDTPEQNEAPSQSRDSQTTDDPD